MTRSSVAAPVMFITGTNTGVGKTLLTGLLWEHLRSELGIDALAVKPFISGGLGDARLLRALQKNRWDLEDLSPYRYRLAMAPAVAAEKEGNTIRLPAAVRYLEKMRRRCECLLVEGCGGLLSPLGRGFSFWDIICRVRGHLVVVGSNRLGTINQVLLTMRALQEVPAETSCVVLMNERSFRDQAARSNAKILSEMLPCQVIELPYLGENASKTGQIRSHAKFLKKTLAGMLAFDTVTSLLEAAVVKAS